MAIYPTPKPTALAGSRTRGRKSPFSLRTIGIAAFALKTVAAFALKTVAAFALKTVAAFALKIVPDSGWQ